MASSLRVGTIGWNHPEWKGLAYPAETRADQLLAQYARLFPIVEVSASYYRTPDTETIALWVGSTPRGFTFSLKVPDWIVRKPADPGNVGKLAWLMERLRPLRDAGKLGVLVAQFPPFFRREGHEEALRSFVTALPGDATWAVELRHPSWWRDETYDLLRAADVTLVWSVVESGRAPPVVTSDRLYLRLFRDHALEGPYDRRQRDATDELTWWVERIRDEGRRAKQVDVLVSNYLEGYAAGTAAALCEMLGLREPDVGPRAGRPRTEQTRLFP